MERLETTHPDLEDISRIEEEDDSPDQPSGFLPGDIPDSPWWDPDLNPPPAPNQNGNPPDSPDD